ncbi:fungal transcription factor regulatory middle homology region domain-containing protein [Streptomyces sp. MUM 16J]|uniref:fungal specific transcription factor domain-containing protein n=1 Tax=Streptomyces sp. MUM 16J TaxID=2791988 RepID=UPI001F039AE6|nr:fungal transcription factor regulatory middle homology region domain-containing protein [Streptomyces sp. MUM 16J]MCH0560860.1 fungal specific transcription factor domain-containing protein [Streptomyces sp. MUM 16J]
MSDGGGSDLRRGLGALEIFQKRVHDALSTFESSPGASPNIARHAIGRASFSGANVPFTEAHILYVQYKQVHERLTRLSKSLGLHIEALRLAVKAADTDYDDVDEEVRRRFWEIQSHLHQEYQQAAKTRQVGAPDAGYGGADKAHAGRSGNSSTEGEY